MRKIVRNDVPRWYQHELQGEPARTGFPAEVCGTELAVFAVLDLEIPGDTAEMQFEMHVEVQFSAVGLRHVFDHDVPHLFDGLVEQ